MDFNQELTNLVIAALPHLTKETAVPIVDHLMSADSVGVTCLSDLPQVDMGMLPSSVIPPIKAKQLVAYFQGVVQGTSAPVQQGVTDQQSVSQRGSAGIQQISNNQYKFLVPWKKLSKDTLEKLDEAEKDQIRASQKVIDELKLEIAKKCVADYINYKKDHPGLQKHPGNNVYKKVTTQVFAKFNHSLADYVNKKNVADGSPAFQRLFKICVENLMRHEKGTKDKNKHGLSKSIVGVSADQYRPLLTAASREIQQGIKEHLQNMSRADPTLWNWDEIIKDMKISYDLQRDDVVKAKERVEETLQKEQEQEGEDEEDESNALQDLKDQWPYLFKPPALSEHHKRLAERDLLPHLVEYVNTHLDMFISYMVCATKKSSRNLAIKRFYEGKTVQWSKPKSLLLAVMLIINHFDEKRDGLLHVVEKTILSSEINLTEVKDLCIIARDLNPVEASAFLVCADSTVLVETDNFQSALQAFFECAFVFDLDYPQQVAKTLEFIERFVLGMGVVSSRVRDKRGKTLLFLTASVRDLSLNYEKFKEDLDSQQRLMANEQEITSVV